MVLVQICWRSLDMLMVSIAEDECGCGQCYELAISHVSVLPAWHVNCFQNPLDIATS